MKKILNGLILIALISFCGCIDEFLDEPIRGQQQLDEFFTSEEACIRFINGTYEMINGNQWKEVSFYRSMTDMATDDMWAGNTAQAREDVTNHAHYTITNYGSDYYVNFWKSMYIGIARCNLALDKIPGVTMDETLRNRLNSETMFLRAFYYFELLINFGGIPIVTDYNELFETDILYYERSEPEEVWQLIESNLLEAIDVLPQKSEYSTEDMGRATKGAAMAYLAKAYLFQEKYEEAENVAGQVISSNEYDLEPDFADIWSVDNHHGIESIFEVEYIYDVSFGTVQEVKVSGVGGYLSVSEGSRAYRPGWGWGTPTSDLENAFLREHDSIRLRSTIIKHGEPVYGDPDVPDGIFDAVPSENKSGRINRKFYIPIAKRPEIWDVGLVPLSHIHMRYADLLLIHAEAAYFNGNQDAALNSLKKVRERVGLTTDMSLSGDALRDAIWKERRLELALECHRLFDIRREKIDGIPVIARILGPEGSFISYNLNENTDLFETTNDQEPMDKGIHFDINKHLVLPIPPQEIQRSEGRIQQNPGY